MLLTVRSKVPKLYKVNDKVMAVKSRLRIYTKIIITIESPDTVSAVS